MNNDLLSKHARSFYWAGFFLSKKTYNKCSILYDFCRTLDDIVDNEIDLEIKKKIFSDFKSSFLKKKYNNPIIKKIWNLLEQENISPKVVYDLFDGVESDLRNEIRISNKNDLFIYSYRVAGTVGLMMSKILKVEDKQSIRGAVDLGIAMQLTNIARDVVEDKKRNRSYISHDFNSIRETIRIADAFYDSAFPAIKAIPFSFRFSIIVARRVYRKIGYNILKQKNITNYNNAGKIYVSNLSKIFETFLSLFDLVKLFFTNSEKYLKKNTHFTINEEINLDERI